MKISTLQLLSVHPFKVKQGFWVQDLSCSLPLWKGINRKQSTRRQHLSRLKASAFFSLQNFFSCYEIQQLILGTGTDIWWVTEPHWNLRF